MILTELWFVGFHGGKELWRVLVAFLSRAERMKYRGQKGSDILVLTFSGSKPVEVMRRAFSLKCALTLEQ